MEASVITAIVGASSALLCAALGAVIQWRLAHAHQVFQLRLEADRRDAELAGRQRDEQARNLLKAHQAVSAIARQFSITALDIAWRAQMTATDYDDRYLRACEAIDEVRAICDLYFPEVSEPLETMHGQMNLFWGSFKEVLRLTELGEPYDRKRRFHEAAVAAAQGLADSAKLAKARLGRIASQADRSG